MLLIINQRCNKVVILLKFEIGGKYIYYKILSEKIGKSVSTIKKWRSKITELSGYEFSFIKIPIGYGKRHGYNWVPNFTDEEVEKFIQTSNLIADNGLDKAIKMVWGDLNTLLEEERESELSILRHSLGRLNSSQLALKVEVKSLSSENVKLRQRVHTFETKLSDLIKKLSENKKIKKLIE